MNEESTDLAHLTRLAVAEQSEDIRLYVARMVRRYRDSNPELARLLENSLKPKASRGKDVLRRTMESNSNSSLAMPVDQDSRLSLIKRQPEGVNAEAPMLATSLSETLLQLIQERKSLRALKAKGLAPTRSAIFEGPPGVGKTMAARWLAAQIGLPLYVLDLTAVMSSFLGRSGGNLRAVLDFAKREPCVLFLDEIDAVAKRRGDESDVGELKRLVTVMLQEVENWPESGLLLAATNHPELIDPALWRRFDLVIKFPMPDAHAIRDALHRYFGDDFSKFANWEDILVKAFEDVSFSDIERDLNRCRRALVLKTATPKELVAELVSKRMPDADNSERIEWAVDLASHDLFSQRSISTLTGVSRDTIRKHIKEQGNKGQRSKTLREVKA